MKPEIIVILCIFLTFIVLEMLFTRFFRKSGQTKDDAVVEIISTGNADSSKGFLVSARGAYPAARTLIPDAAVRTGGRRLCRQPHRP